MSNRFLAWKNIIDELATIESIRLVAPLPRFFEKDEFMSFPTPAVFVGFAGDSIDNAFGVGSEQRYAVWVLENATRSDRELDTVMAMGEIINDITNTLRDYQPGDDYSPLERIDSKDPVQYFPGGSIVYSMWFTTVFSAD